MLVVTGVDSGLWVEATPAFERADVEDAENTTIAGEGDPNSPNVYAKPNLSQLSVFGR